MSVEVHVRAALRDDPGRVVELERSIAEAPHWSEEVYAAMLSSGTGAVVRCLLVAEGKQGKLAGFVVVEVVRSAVNGWAELESLAVAADARRAGVGRALCEEALAWCRR